MALKRVAQALCVLLLLCGCIFSQSMSGTVQGTVTDPGDAAVPGANVELKNTTTGAVRTTTSTPEGLFRFNSIEPAVYSLTVKAGSGFKALTLNDINLSATEIRELGKLKLSLGSLTEQVEVTAAVTPVQTSSSENSKLVDASQIADLTLRGRDMFGMLETLPGVSLGDTYMTQGSGVETTGHNNIQYTNINGGQPVPQGGGGGFFVDGILDNNPASDNGVFFEPNLDSIAEMRVLTTNYQAEYGRSDGPAITVVTKSGSQQFHGTAQANKRHEMFNAKNFFTNYNGQIKPQYRFFVWSYSIGGPVAIPKLPKIFKKKMFFFFSQEYTRQKPGPASGYANVPSANEKAGDFSYYTNSNGAITSNSLRNPLTGVYFTPSATNPSLANFAQYAGNFDAQSEKYGQAMLNDYPLPNLCNASAGTSDGKPWNGLAAGAGGSNLISPTNCPTSLVAANPYLATGSIDAQGGPGTTNNQTRNYFWFFQGSHPRRNDMLRVDYNVTSKLTFWFRYGNDYDQDGTTASLPNRNASGTFLPVQIIHPSPGHNYGFNLTYAISPSLVNEFTAGKSYVTWSWYPGDQSELNRSNVGNPPSFDNFATDPKFVNDVNLPRPTLSPGSNNYQVGIPAISYGGGQLTEASITNSGCSGMCPYTNGGDIYTFNDALSKVIGKHNLKAGLYAEKTVYYQNSAGVGSYLGSYSFAGGNVLNPHDAGDGWANAYLGQMNSYSEGGRSIENLSQWDVEWFAQDNWRVTPRLTLDLGLRFYHLPPGVDLNHTASQFTFSTYNPAAAERIYYPFCTVSTTTAACPSNTATTTYQYAWDPKTNPNKNLALMAPSGQVGTLVPYSVGGYTATSDPYTGMQIASPTNSNLPFSLYTTPWATPAVRIGFAWDVFGNGKTAIRGGFGQTDAHATLNDCFQYMCGQSPVNVNQIQNFGSISSIASSPLDYTNGVRSAPNNMLIGLSPYGPTSSVGHQPYDGNYNGTFMVQQNVGFSTVVEASYVLDWRRHSPMTQGGFNGVASPGITTNGGALFDQLQPQMINPLNAYLAQYIGPNANNASGMPYSDNYFRPIQGYGAMTYFEWEGSQDYNALQVSVRRNFKKHFSFGFAYTFSKTMALTSRSQIFPDKFRNWAPSYSPAPQVAVFNYVYEAPNLAEKMHFKPLGIITDHWSISGITQFRSDRMTGYPSVSEYSNTNSTNNVGLSNTGTSLEGANALVVGNPELPSGQVSFVGGPTTAAALNGNINGTPGNQIFNNGAVIPVLPCSYTVQANPRLGIGQNMECFGNEGPGSLFAVPHTAVNNWDVTFTKNFPLKKEGRNLSFRLETFNLFNHTQFNGWSTGQSYDWANYKNGVSVPQTGGTGRYNSALQPRLMSMTLRLVF